MTQQYSEELELDLVLASLEAKGLIQKVQGGYILTETGYIQAIIDSVTVSDNKLVS